MTTVTATLSIAYADGTFPTKGPEALATVKWMPSADPAILGLEYRATYDADTGLLSWTLPASSQVQFRVATVSGLSGIYTMPATGTIHINSSIPAVPSTEPGWAANLIAVPSPSTKGTLMVSDGVAWDTLGVGANGTFVKADSTAANGLKYAALTEADVTDLVTDLASKVPTARTVNGHALSADVTVSVSDVGGMAEVAPGTAGNVLTSDGTKWISHAPPAGSGSLPGGVSGDVQTNDGAGGFAGGTALSSLVTTSRLVNGHALSADVTVTAADVGAEPAITAGTTGQYWRGDKTWQTLPAATPGGSSGQLQFNNAGAFGGIPGTSANATTGAITLTAGAATTTPLTITGAAGQSVPLLSIIEASDAPQGLSITNPTGTTSTTIGGYLPGITMTCWGKRGVIQLYPDFTIASASSDNALSLNSIYSYTAKPAITISQNYDPRNLTSSGLWTGVGLNTQFSFAPTSGSLSTDFVVIGGTINQTGTASGNWRSLVVNPTITASLGTANYLAWFGTNGTAKATLSDTGAMNLTALTASGTVTAAAYKLSALNTAPSSASDTGTAGEIRVTADYIYVCTATNTWVRAALTTW